MSLMKKKSRENGEQESNRKIETNSSSSIISTTNEQSTKNMFNEDYSTKMALTRSTSTHNSLDDITTNLVNKSKSMANRAQMFTLPRLIENNVHKEMAKFYNQQYYVTQLISNKIAQPIAAWTKINQNRIINFLIEYKGRMNYFVQFFQKKTSKHSEKNKQNKNENKLNPILNDILDICL